jgi:hypothetical protein
MVMGALVVAARVLVAVFGGYAFSAASSAALALALARGAGLARGEAVLLAAMLGFVVYLIVLLWAFTARSLGRVAVVVLGGALAGYGLVRLAIAGG